MTLDIRNMFQKSLLKAMYINKIISNKIRLLILMSQKTILLKDDFSLFEIIELRPRF